MHQVKPIIYIVALAISAALIGETIYCYIGKPSAFTIVEVAVGWCTVLAIAIYGFVKALGGGFEFNRKSLKQQLAEKEVELEAARTELDEAKSRERDLENELDDATAKVTELEHELEDVKTDDDDNGDSPSETDDTPAESDDDTVELSNTMYEAEVCTIDENGKITKVYSLEPTYTKEAAHDAAIESLQARKDEGQPVEHAFIRYNEVEQVD